MRSTLKFAAFAIALSGVAPSAQVVKPVPIQPPKAVATTASRTSTAPSVIHGTAMDVKAAPLPNAIVRLRNLSTNKIEQTATTDGRGEFTFAAKPDVPYVVEIVNAKGQVLAVGDVVSTQTGEVASAVVSIPTHVSPTDVFRDTTASVISAAAGMGLTAVDATAAPLDSPSQ